MPFSPTPATKRNIGLGLLLAFIIIYGLSEGIWHASITLLFCLLSMYAVWRGR